jgi:CpXC motif protein
MSDLYSAEIACPRCQARQAATLFRSLNADALAAQVEAIVDGSFEQKRCAACAHTFRPEHSMLYVHHTARLWIVMHPLGARHRFVALEREVLEVMEREVAWTPPAVAQELSGLRPRLVFGQHMLTEAVRMTRAGLDAALLECAKLLTVRRQLGRLMAHGPCELCFERRPADGGVVCAVHLMSSGERIDELEVSAAGLAEVEAERAYFEQSWPDLFQRPYVSTSRYLYGDEKL